MAPRLRKFVLTVHVVSSVGWLGAVVGFVAIAVVALTSQDIQAVRGALLVMEPIGWYVLAPMVLGSLLTGLIQSLGTQWGFIRYYWVLFKLVIGVVSTYVLLLFLTITLRPVASAAADPVSSADALRALAGAPLEHALIALAGLLTATVLAVYKPRAMTRYWQRKKDGQRSARRERVESVERVSVGSGRGASAGLARWVKVSGFSLGVVAWGLAVALVLGGGHQSGGERPSGDMPGMNHDQEMDPNMPGMNHDMPDGGG